MNDPRQSSLERKFVTLWIAFGGPQLEYDQPFAPGRRWRADFIHRGAKVIVEIEGWGRHQRWLGYTEDCRKYNAALVLGYRVFRLTRDMIDNTPWADIQPIIDFVVGHAAQEISP